jgi:hypothetical protein
MARAMGPFMQQPVPFGLGQQRQRADDRVWARGRGGGENAEMAGHAGYRGGVEQIGGGAPGADPLARVHNDRQLSVRGDVAVGERHQHLRRRRRRYGIATGVGELGDHVRKARLRRDPHAQRSNGPI